jgi:annexin A7/11
MQRGYIQHEFKTMYSEELSRRISSELSGNHKVLETTKLIIIE